MPKRTRPPVFVGLIHVLALLIFLAGCSNPVIDGDPRGGSTGGGSAEDGLRYGELLLRNGELAGSTVAPELSELSRLVTTYNVLLRHSSGTYADRTVSGYQEGDTIPRIPVGTWTITVNGIDAAGNLVAQDVQEVAIAEGANELIANLEPLQALSGTVSYAVDWSAVPATTVVNNLAVSLDPYPWGGGDSETLQFPESGTRNFQTVSEGSVTVDFAARTLLFSDDSIPSGFYRLRVLLRTGSNAYAPIIEVLQIYDHLDSDGGTVTLEADDLTSPPQTPTDLSATITGDGAFSLNWNDASTTEEGFRLYLGAVDDTPEATIGAGLTGVTSVELGYAGTAGDPITYSVVAANRFGESTPETITFTPLGLSSLFPTGTPGSPTVQNGSVNLGWGTFLGVDTYNLYISQTQADVDSLDPGVRTTNAAAGNAASSYISLTDGTTYYWTVEAVNPEGNGTLAAPTAAFTVDSTPPTNPTITGVPPNPTNIQGGNTATFTGDPGVDFVYSLTGATTLGGTSVADADSNGSETVTLPFLNEGANTLSVTARDSGGNESTPANYSFTVDVTVATPTGVTGGDVTAAPTDYTTISNPSFSWDAGEAGAEFEYSLDGGTSVEGTTTNTTVAVGPIAPGAYDFAVRQVDAASNVSGWSATLPFTYVEPTTVEITISDPTVPLFSIGGAGTTLDRTAADVWPLTVSVTGGTIAAYDWWLNGTSQATAATYDLAANDVGTVLGTNTLTLFVEIDGRWYSREILFEVVEN